MAQFQTTPVSQLADSYDAVIVGSGGTGLAAAIQAHEPVSYTHLTLPTTR